MKALLVRLSSKRFSLRLRPPVQRTNLRAESKLVARCSPSAVPLVDDVAETSEMERQGAQLSTEPSGPGVRWRLWPLMWQHFGEEASFFGAYLHEISF